MSQNQKLERSLIPLFYPECCLIISGYIFLIKTNRLSVIDLCCGRYEHRTINRIDLDWPGSKWQWHSFERHAWVRIRVGNRLLNIFLVMTLEDLPLFVASDLSNLPPLSMDNFDMSSVVREMEIIKNQMRIMQEVQETSLKVHAALCDDKSREHHEDHDEQSSVGQSPAPSTGATPLRQSPHTPEMSPPTVDDTMRTPIQHRRIDDDGGTDEDILLLAQLQGRIPFSPNGRSQQRSAPERQPTTPADADRHRHRNRERDMSINRERGRQDMDMTHNSHRDEDRRRSHMTHNRHIDDNRYTLTEHRGWPNDRYNRDGRYNRDDRYNRDNPRDRSNRRINMHTQHDNKKGNRSARNTVITGTSNSRTLTAATPRNTQQKDGLIFLDYRDTLVLLMS